MPPPRREFPAAEASEIFVDREDPKRVFEKAALSIPAEGCLLRCWYGVGGQGKSALARELFRMTAAAADPSHGHLRRAMLDLHGRSKTDPDLLLVWIRNAFAREGMGFPAFDLAFAIMWEATRGEEALPNLISPWLRRSSDFVQDGGPEMLKLTGELVAEIGMSIPGLNFLLKRGVRWGIEAAKRGWLEQTRPQLHRLHRGGAPLEPHEYSALMPWMLAQDMNRHLAAHPDERFVLFVDEYESVFDGAGTGARWRENRFDTHLRGFIAETDGLLAVFFSREKLVWEEDADWRDALAGHQHLLGGLSDTDADNWLRQVPVEDEALRIAMIAGARETPDPAAPVYPLMLDLQVAHWRNLKGRAEPRDFHVGATGFEARRRELVRRLLRDYSAPLQSVMEHLSLVRRFDRETFLHVVEERRLALSLDDFDRLAALSIVSRDEAGWLALHTAIADAIAETLDQDKRKAVEDMLLRHFLTRANPPRVADVSASTLACYSEAVRLRKRQGIEGYPGWVALASVMIRESARSSFVVDLLRDALDFGTSENHRDVMDTTVLRSFRQTTRSMGT